MIFTTVQLKKNNKIKIDPLFEYDTLIYFISSQTFI